MLPNLQPAICFLSPNGYLPGPWVTVREAGGKEDVLKRGSVYTAFRAREARKGEGGEWGMLGEQDHRVHGLQMPKPIGVRCEVRE